VKIDIDTIGDGGLDLNQPLTLQWIADTLAPGQGYTAAHDGKMRIHMLRAGTTIVVRGSVTMPLRAPCSRCLTPVIYSKATRIELTLIPDTEMAASSPDGQLTDDQVSLGTYEDPYVDLGEVLHDEVLLNLPMQPLCSEQCRGLCNSCGTNRNDQDCACDDEADLGPLGALRHMHLSNSTTKKDD
jgi:uncharacterized protein